MFEDFTVFTVLQIFPHAQEAVLKLGDNVNLSR